MFGTMLAGLAMQAKLATTHLIHPGTKARPAITAEQKTAMQAQQADHQAKIAAILGISADDLKARLASGKKMTDIISDLKLDATAVQQKMAVLQLETIKARYADAVKSGKLTQAQADAKIAEIQKAIDSGKFPGPMMGGRGGMMGRGEGLGLGEKKESKERGGDFRKGQRHGKGAAPTTTSTPVVAK